MKTLFNIAILTLASLGTTALAAEEGPIIVTVETFVCTETDLYFDKTAKRKRPQRSICPAPPSAGAATRASPSIRNTTSRMIPALRNGR